MQKKSVSRRTILRGALLTAAFGMIALGLFRQEHLTVLQKAIRICLECIGVG